MSPEVLQAIEHVGELLGAHGLARRARDGAAAGHEQVRVVGHDAVLLVQLERLVEAFAQFGQGIAADRPGTPRSRGWVGRTPGRRWSA